jgi:mannose-6-phosphate isomerase-like protein (cupin superfamily)
MPSTPFVLDPSEGETYDIGPFHIVARVLQSQSGGLFELYDLSLSAATIDYHVHNKMDETLCVVEGQIEFNVQGTKFLRPAGSVAYVPRGLHHGFTNLGPARARVLITFTPPTGQHEYFRQLEKLFAGGTPDPVAVAALQKKYDQELIAPGT